MDITKQDRKKFKKASHDDILPGYSTAPSGPIPQPKPSKKPGKFGDSK